MVAQACNPRPGEGEAGGLLCVQGQPEIHSTMTNKQR